MRKLCSSVKCFGLLSCPLTAPDVPQYQRQLLQWGEWLAEDVPCCYSVCQVQESWSHSAPSLAPKRTLCEGTLLLFDTSFILSFVSFGLSFLQTVSTGHSVSFILHPLLELPIQCRVQPHLRESFYILNLLKALHKCSWLSVSCGLWWPLKSEAKLWGWTSWGSPYICFQTQNLNYNFPRSNLYFGW